MRDAAFGCDWVGTPIQFQRCLMFIIATANKGFQLTAGKFVPVSNVTLMNVCKKYFVFFFVAQEPLVGLGFLHVEGSRSHSDTPHSVGFLQTSDQPEERGFYLKTPTHKDSDAPGGIRNRISHQVRCLRPMPYIARPPESANTGC